jgi:putative transposase
MAGWGGTVAALKQVEEENRKLKQLVADLCLDKHIPQEVVQKEL